MPTYRIKDPAVIKMSTSVVTRGRVLSPADIDPDFVAWPASVETPLHITGVVRDASGTAVVGATVKLVRQRDDKLIMTTTSNGSGVYSFNRSPRDTNSYYVVAFSVVGGTTQIHGTSERGLVGT